VRIDFAARMGVTYQPQRSTDFQVWADDGALLTIPVVNPPLDPLTNIVRPVLSNTNQMFHRVRVSY
jgi:hypothetical protein